VTACFGIPSQRENGPIWVCLVFDRVCKRLWINGYCVDTLRSKVVHYIPAHYRLRYEVLVGFPNGSLKDLLTQCRIYFSMMEPRLTWLYPFVLLQSFLQGDLGERMQG
jgi:hypothetical protein